MSNLQALRLRRPPRKPVPVSLLRNHRLITCPAFKVTLRDVLAFIEDASVNSLREIRKGMNARRAHLEYEVVFKSGRIEQWTVDDSDQMIDILLRERKSISHVKPGKEYIQ